MTCFTLLYYYSVVIKKKTVFLFIFVPFLHLSFILPVEWTEHQAPVFLLYDPSQCSHLQVKQAP